MIRYWEEIILVTIVAIAMVFLCFVGYSIVGSSANLEYVKEHSEQTASDKGLTIVGYEGWRRSFKGARVWYHFNRVPENGILYSGAFQKRPFSDEIHLFNFKAIDAIKPLN